MRKRGMSDEDIVEELANKGHTYQEISEALNQADIKMGVASVPNNFSEFGQMQESALSKGAGTPSIEEIPAPSPGGETTEEQPQTPPTIETPSMPAAVQYAPQAPSLSSEDIQELIESIIEDRWQQVVASVGDISLWKSKVDDDLVSIKQEILRVEDRMTRLQASLIGRVDEYSKAISKVGSEVEALEKVFQKIMDPLTTNIKELNRITQELKKK
ncbi:MAG: hypothetical protein QXR60_00825 [Candidatus Nanoarchaeia archaeon]